MASSAAITHAAAHDGAQLGAVLDPGNTASAVSADTAYRSAANIAMLERRGLKPEAQTGGKSMPLHMAATSAAPHPFARRPRSAASTIRTAGKARATAKLALANFAYNFTRLACHGAAGPEGAARSALRPAKNPHQRPQSLHRRQLQRVLRGVPELLQGLQDR